MFDEIPIGETEDEPWAPTSIAFAFLAAQCACLGPASAVCDLGAGAAVSSIAIARRCRARVYAIDSSSCAVAAANDRAREYSVSDRFTPIQMDVLGYLATAGKEGARFDLVLAEGGIAGAVGHEPLLNGAVHILRPGGVLVLSGYAYNGVSIHPTCVDSIHVTVPQDVRMHHESSRHANGHREILEEQELLCLIERRGLSILANFRAGQNHWSRYFDRMHRMAAEKTGAALVYGSTERQIGIEEAFHNLRSQKYLSYAVTIAKLATST